MNGKRLSYKELTALIMEAVKQRITGLAREYSKTLKDKVALRVQDMQKDNNSHYLIYRILGITSKEADMIDVYQNKGRFLYKYAGSFLEEVTILCFEEKFENAQRKVKIPNTISPRPKKFEIDCLVGNNAYEIKWRDATTDGDHITKEHTRVRNMQEKGYKPVRIMFYYPLRERAIKIQKALETIYMGVQGEYYYGDNAWGYVKKETSIDLFSILEKVADDNSK